MQQIIVDMGTLQLRTRCDLSSRRDAPRVAAEAMELVPHLDLLLNNAERSSRPDRRSADGIELTCALNHLSYFLLTSPVLERLWETAQGRIINVSSCAHESPGRFRNVQRLRIFGKALNLPKPRWRASLCWRDWLRISRLPANIWVVPSLSRTRRRSRSQSATHRRFRRWQERAETNPQSRQFLRAALRRLAFRLLLPALYVVMGGYALSAMGWNDDWMPLAYLMVTSLLVVTQTLVWPDRRGRPG